MPERNGFPRRGWVGVAAWIVGTFASVSLASAASSLAYFGQVQSQLEALDGAPLIAANWQGRYRPYVLASDAFVPLLRAEHAEIADVDLVSPMPVSKDRVLLVGSAAGRPEYDLFLYDRSSDALSNLTATPSVDEGRPCVDDTTGMLAYRTGTGEVIARLQGGLRPFSHGRLPAFESCTWLDATTLLGIERLGRGYRLHRCRIGEDAVACDGRAALDDVDAVSGFQRTRSPITIIARRRNQMFRRAWVLTAPFDTLTAAALPATPEGDVLDLDDGAVRIGFQGRYASSLAPGSSAIVYLTRRIGDTTYAIVATDRMTRTVARLDHGTWQLLRAPGVVMPAHLATPLEVWMRSPAGEVYQAFYFGPTRPERVVVWWHGGPAESISPRFNPYFHRLNELGFGVLAVNYPGSTGRGAVYEARFRPDMLGDCVRAVWAYLRENEIGTVVSWSVSSGITVQSAVLAERVPVSALVDQSAWGRSAIRQEAAGRGIPTFAIRGRHDPYGPTDIVDHWYAGGHDVTVAEEFSGLFDAVAPFLAAARRVSWDEPGDVSDLLEVGAAEKDRLLGFELATHLHRSCFANRGVIVTPAGVPSLNAPESVRRHVVTWLARHPSTRVVRIGLGHGSLATMKTPTTGRVLDLHPIDLADAAASDRLRPHTLAPDGWLVHPGLQAAAESQCALVRTDADRREPTRSP